MKIIKSLMFLALAAFGTMIGLVSFWFWAYDGFGDDDITGTYELAVYSAPKGGAQLVILTKSDFHGDTDHYFGVRASKSAALRPFFLAHTSSPNQEWIPYHVGWSIDGSVVALGNTIRDIIRRNQGPGFFKVSDGFRAAYDFRAAKGYLPTPQWSKGASQQIFKLIEACGGWKLSNTALGNRRLSSWRWEDADYKQLIEKIREKEHLSGDY